MIETLLELYRHNIWANLRLLDFLESQPDELLDRSIAGTCGTTRETLIHYLKAEEGYAGRLRGKHFDDELEPSDPFPGFDELRRRARRSGEALLDVAATTPHDRVYRLHMDKERDAMALLYVVQAINHATEHRAQIATTLSTFGVEPIGLDAWEWGFETGALKDVEDTSEA